jgi:hypothetical protein
VKCTVDRSDGDVRHFGDQVDAAALFGHCRSGVLRLLEYTVKGNWERDSSVLACTLTGLY